MNGTSTTKMYKNNQTVIPSFIRKKYGVSENTIITWIEDDEGNITVHFREKVNFEDMLGAGSMVKEKTDSVQLKKELYKWKYF